MFLKASKELGYDLNEIYLSILADQVIAKCFFAV